jgi:ribose/xylose/arabinose/galactoside ABC-type transport system permease subunit
MRRVGRRKRRHIRVRMVVYIVFAVLTLAAALAGLAVNHQVEQVWEAHWRWLEAQHAVP